MDTRNGERTDSIVKYPSFYSKAAAAALQYAAPGSWMPQIPESCIRLSAGYPAPSLVPDEDIKRATDFLIAKERDLPFQYLGSPMMATLRQQIQQRLGQRGIPVTEDELLVTAGACQAIDLVAHALLDEEAIVAVEAPTYMEALEVFRNYTGHFVEIPVDESGLCIDVYEEMLVKRRRAGLAIPKLLYTIPSFHNPTGVTLSMERRKRLLDLAERFDFLILEDDAYGELAFGATPVPLKTLDADGRVIHIGSLSKVVAPGMRIGWIAGPGELVKAFGWVKKDLDHPFAEATVAQLLEGIDLEEHLQRLRGAYQDRRDVMLSALEKFMPGGVKWSHPEGGFFVWLHLPGVDTSSLLTEALQAGVSFVPGKHFFVQSDGNCEYLRLSYSYVEPELITKGIVILGAMLGKRQSS